MSHAERHIRAFAIFQPEHVIAHHFPASGFLPDFGGVNCRQDEFLSAYAVHLFADDLDDLQAHSLGQRQQRVNACGQLTDVACANQ